MISSLVKITCYLHMWKYHLCYSYIINRAFHTKKLLKCNGLVFHWCSCWKNISRVSAANEWNIFQHSKRNFLSPRGHVISFLYLSPSLSLSLCRSPSLSLSLSPSFYIYIYIYIYFNFLLPKKRGRLCIVICLIMTGSVLNLSPFRKKFLRNGLKVYSGGNFKKIPLSWSNFECFFFSCSSFLLNFDSSSFKFFFFLK